MTQPAAYPSSYPSPAAPRSPAPLIVAGAIGLVVGVVLVGALWLIVGGTSGTDSDPVSAPAKLGDYQRFGDVKGGGSSDTQQRVASHVADSDTRSGQLLADAYGGAGAAVQTYASGDLRTTFELSVVRASTPGLYVGYQDAEYLGLAAPPREVKQFGNVQCVVQNEQASAGSETPPRVVQSDCQRVADELTVRIRPTSGELAQHPDQVATLVDQAFAALG